MNKNKEGVLLNNDGVDDVLEDGKGDESVVSIWSVLKNSCLENTWFVVVSARTLLMKQNVIREILNSSVSSSRWWWERRMSWIWTVLEHEYVFVTANLLV